MSPGEKLQLLCFRLGRRVFALDIMGIREILRHQPVTPVPNAPRGLAGVLNVRGMMLPVVDLHPVLLPAGEEVAPTEGPVPMVVLVRSGGDTLGLMVDWVLDVVSVDVAELNPLPGASPSRQSVVVGAFRREIDNKEEVVLLVRLGALARIAREGMDHEPT